MKCSKRRYFTQADKNLMWDRWQKGESLNSIARLLGTSHSAISGVRPVVFVQQTDNAPGLH